MADVDQPTITEVKAHQQFLRSRRKNAPQTQTSKQIETAGASAGSDPDTDTKSSANEYRGVGSKSGGRRMLKETEGY